jgi:hypothetical protein
MSHHKQPERRTFLQDRLEILIKKQRLGTANFNELTELDQIVNSDPAIIEKIIKDGLLMDDNGDFIEPLNPPEQEDVPYLRPVAHVSLLNRLKALLSRMFYSQISVAKIKLLLISNRQVVLL